MLDKLKVEAGYPFNIGIKDTSAGKEIVLFVTKQTLDKIVMYKEAGVYNEPLLDKHGVHSVAIKVVEDLNKCM